MPFYSPDNEAPGFRGPSGVVPPNPVVPPIQDVIGAAFRQENTVVSTLRKLYEEQYPSEEGHNPLDIIRDTKFEQHHLDSFVASRSEAETRAIMRRIDGEDEDRRLLSAAGIAGNVAALAAGLIDPTIALPAGQIVRSVKGGYSVIKSAGTVGAAAALQSTAQEAALQASQETRPYSQSVMSIGSATLLGALLGAGAASMLSKAERAGLERALDVERANIDVHAGNAAPDVVRATAASSDIRGELNLYFNGRVGGKEDLSLEAQAILDKMPDDVRQAGWAVTSRGSLEHDIIGDSVLDEATEVAIRKQAQPQQEADAKLFNDWLSANLNERGPSTSTGLAAAAGAAASDTRRLELESSGLGFTNRISPTRRTLAAESIEARRTMADLAETPYRFKENEAGIATTQGPALDRLARNEINGTRVVVSDELDRLFAEYRFGDQEKTFPRARAQFERMTGRDTESMTFGEFKREVSRALQEGDQHSIPQVAQAAQTIRAKVFEPWKERAIAAGLLPEDVSVRTAESYFQRVYNKELIAAKRPEFVTTVTDWLRSDQETKRVAKARIEPLNDQLGALQQQIKKLESRSDRAEQKIKQFEAKAAERARDDRPKTAGMNEAAPTGRTAELQRKKIEAEIEAEELSDAVDLARELRKQYPMLSPVVQRNIDDLDKKYVDLRVKSARHAEAGLSAKRSERRLAALEEKLNEASTRKQAIDDMLAVASEVHDNIRIKIEEEIAAWEGKSVKEAKSALKAREKYRTEAEAAGKTPGAGGRLTGADDAIDRAVKRILESDRELDDEALRSRAQEITDRILGSPDGRLPYDIHMGGPEVGWRGTGNEPPRGALAAREFAIPDAMIRDYLEQDVEKVVALHLRTMIPDVLLTERFGDVRMTEALKRITEDYAARIDAATSEKARKALGKERDMVIDSIAGVRDRIRGTYGWNPGLRNMARVVNGVKAVNNLTSMGVSAISSLPDFAGAVFRNGMATTFRDGWVPYLRYLTGNLPEFDKFKSQMRALGIGVETAINARQHALDDVLDVYQPHSRFERSLQGASDKFFVANLLAPLTDIQKTIAAHVSVSEILRATKAASEGRATKRHITNLAEAGIDTQMAGRIWGQFGNAGEVTDGVHLPNTADWTDKGAARALEGAVAREVDIAVVTPGQEKPLWMSDPTLSVLGQFRSFTASATERIVVANLQRRDAAVLQGIITSMALGMLSYKLNSAFGGQKTSDRPQDWIKEGIGRSGLTGWFEEGNALASKMSRGGVDVYRMIGADKPLSRFASRSTLDMLLGPTAGKIGQLSKVTGATASGDWKESDTTALRRLIFLQNLFYTRGLFNQAEEGFNHRFGIEMKPR